MVLVPQIKHHVTTFSCNILFIIVPFNVGTKNLKNMHYMMHRSTHKDPSFTLCAVTFPPSAVVSDSPEEDFKRLETALPTKVGMQRFKTE